MIYALDTPYQVMNYSIVHLEILNIMFALKIWGQCWRDQYIQFFCDNLLVVQVLQTGKARDDRLAMFASNFQPPFIIFIYLT